MTHSRDSSATKKQRFPSEVNVAQGITASRQTERHAPESDTTGISDAPGSVLPSALLETNSASQLYYPKVELFRQDASASDIFLIESGLVKLSRIEKNGREIIVDLRFPGWLLGASSIILKRPHAVSAITLTNCYLRRLSAPSFYHLVESDPLVSMYVHQMHSREVLDKINNIAQLGCLTARDRLIHLLRRLISVSSENESPFGVKIQLPLKYWELAQLIAVTPEHLSRLLKQMQQKGILRQEKDWLFLKDPGVIGPHLLQAESGAAGIDFSQDPA